MASDPSFADALIVDPRVAISELVGMDLPTSLAIDVHRESLAHLHVVVPVLDVHGELQDEDLELVAGGAFSWVYGSKRPASQKPASA
jgi:hypothetical protein